MVSVDVVVHLILPLRRTFVVNGTPRCRRWPQIVSFALLLLTINILGTFLGSLTKIRLARGLNRRGPILHNRRMQPLEKTLLGALIWLTWLFPIYVTALETPRVRLSLRNDTTIVRPPPCVNTWTAARTLSPNFTLRQEAGLLRTRIRALR